MMCTCKPCRCNNCDCKWYETLLSRLNPWCYQYGTRFCNTILHLRDTCRVTLFVHRYHAVTSGRSPPEHEIKLLIKFRFISCGNIGGSMNILEMLVIRRGKPTWLHSKILMSNPVGRIVFRFFFRMEMRRRDKRFRTMLLQLQEVDLDVNQKAKRFLIDI